MTSPAPLVTVEYRRAHRAAGYPWQCQPHMTTRLGEREVPLFPVTIEDLRIAQKYGRWFEPRSFALMLSRLTTARRREALAFLAAMLHRAAAAVHLAALTAPARDPGPRPRGSDLRPTRRLRAPPACALAARRREDMSPGP